MSLVLNKMLKKQSELADLYKYKPLPPIISILQRQEYFDNLPSWVNIEGKNQPIFSPSGIQISNGYERCVIGDYGAFIEIADDDIIKDNIIIKEGEEYRLNEKRYSDHVKYIWYCPEKGYPTKIYFQKKTVNYADYKIGYWYISPYECSDKEFGFI